MVDLGPYKAQYSLVNEDDDEYVTYYNIDDALAKLVEFPNDHIEVTLVRKPQFSNPHDALRYHVSGAVERGEKEAITAVEASDEWLVTGRDADGNSKRFVIHSTGFVNAAESARINAYHNWGFGSQIDSLVRQPEPESDTSCHICGDPRGH